MGYLLLFESMLDTVLFARDHFLAPGGVVLPDYCILHIQGLADPDLHHRHQGYWDDVYGFKMTCMKHAVLQELEASVVYVDKAKLVTQPTPIKVSGSFAFVFAGVQSSEPEETEGSQKEV